MPPVQKYHKIIIGAFFLIIFVLSLKPPADFDLWYHLKSGEIFLENGLKDKDIFSFSAQGRRWYINEWLFQVGASALVKSFGLEAMRYFVATAVLLQVILLWTITRNVIRSSIPTAIFSCLFFFASTYEFFSPRPHMVAHTLLLANLLLVLLYFHKGKNLLLLTLPVTLVWTNLHGSIFLDVWLFLSFELISLVNYLTLKEPGWLQKTRVFAVFLLLTIVITILPPLGLTQYQILWLFFQNLPFLNRFVAEWTPTLQALPAFAIFFGSSAMILGGFLFTLTIQRKGALKAALWIFPLFPLVFFAFGAARNVYLANLALSLILAWTLSRFTFKSLPRLARLTTICFLILFFLFSGVLIQQKSIPEKLLLPRQATNFLANHQLVGHMFNQFEYGGYLLYHLYPKYQIFLDGRGDVYLCCEYQDYFLLAQRKNLPDPEYLDFVENVFKKYSISFVILDTSKNTIFSRIARVLTNDPGWSLVFWDDNDQIFVKKNGQNDSIIASFGATSATPYSQNPYRDGMIDQALIEYQRILPLAESAKTRNAIGYILMQKGLLEKAQPYFEKAIELDPTFESPYMNLGELSVNRGDITQAIKLYQIAKELAPDRKFIELRLKELNNSLL